MQTHWVNIGDNAPCASMILQSEESYSRTILILLDRPEHAYSEGKVLGAQASAVAERVITYAVDNLGSNRAYRIIIACPPRASRTTSPALEAIRFIRKVNPDALVLGGFRLPEMLLGKDKKKHLFGYLKKAKLTATSRKGREVKVRIPTIVTVPLGGWCDPKPAVKGDNGGGLVTMIGEVVDHLQAALVGSNKYDISKSVHMDHEFIDTKRKFKKFFDQLLVCETPSIDTETANLNKIANTLLSIQFCLPQEDGSYKLFFLPMQHKEATWLPEEYEYVSKRLKRYFESGKSKYLIFHNAKFDIIQMYNNLNVRWLNHKLYDTVGGEFSLDENRKFLKGIGIKPYTLQTLEYKYGYVRAGLSIDKEDRSDMSNKPLSEIAPYGVLDTATTYLIHRCQVEEARRRGYKGFVRLVTNQISAMTKVMSRMEFNGSLVDGAYLQEMVAPDSIVNKTITDSYAKFKKSKAARKVNNRAIKTLGHDKSGLFGSVEKPWVFDIAKKDFQQALFFDVLKLAPISVGKSGVPSIGKSFQETYKHVEEVKLYTQLNKMNKIKSAFINSLHARLLSDEDALIDGCIRSHYSYASIISGRSGCFIGSTPVYTLDSRGKVPIKDLKPGDWVWSCNTKTFVPEPSQVEKAWLTGVKETVKVSFRIRRGHKKWIVRSVECTPDHRFLTFDGSYKEAGDLVPGDRVISMRRHQYRGRGSKAVYRELYFSKKKTALAIPEHRLVHYGAEYLSAIRNGEHVHHRDKDGLNNIPTNLEPIDPSTHSTLHGKEEGRKLLVGINNPEYVSVPKKHVLKAFKTKEGFQKVRNKQGATEYVLQKRADELGLDWSLRPWVRGRTLKLLRKKKLLTKKTLRRVMANCNGKPTVAAKHFCQDYATFQKIVADLGCNMQEEIYIARGVRILTEKDLALASEKLRGGLSNNKTSKFFGMPVSAFKVQFYGNWTAASNKGCWKVTPLMKEKAANFKNMENVSRYLGVSKIKARRIVEKSHNHEIVSVKSTGRKVKVYDIKVSKNSNFYADGVCVHNCSDPNLQQIPSRGALAPIVKRVFIAGDGRVLAKADFSAHEIRGFGIISGDVVIARTFAKAQEAIDALRLCKPEELEAAKERMKKDGDIHIQNVKLFYNQTVDSDHPLRSQVKSGVFGVMYGMTAPTLAAQINGTEEEAQTIIDKLFEKWPVAGQWIENTHEIARSEFKVMSPIGRVRHLMAYLHGGMKLRTAMDRRAVNSIIQGYASDAGYMAMQMVADEYWHTFDKKGLGFGMKQVNAVHDSSTTSTFIESLPIAAYLIEHGMVTLAARHYKEVFHIDTPIPYGFDLQFGLNEADMKKWKDYRFDTLATIATELADGAKATKLQTRNLIHNIDKIRVIREKEVRRKKQEMILYRDTNWYKDNMKLSMWS